MDRQVPDWIDGYLELTDNSEPPVSFRMWAAIHTLAAVLQRKCVLPWGPLSFYPNLYIVLIAPPGAARKGTALGPALDFLTEPELGIKLAAEAITREALIRELKNANETVINPFTGEMTFHSSLTIHSQELTVFLGYQNSQLMSDLVDWFDCRKRWTYRTKWSGTDEIIGVWVNLIGATTPDLIQTSLPIDSIGVGLTSRMIFVYEERRGKSVADPFLSQREKDLRIMLLHDLERIKLLSGAFKVSADFIEFWLEWYPKQEIYRPFEDVRFGGYFERRPTHIMKLSMLVNVARTDKMLITRLDLERAIRILDFTEKKMFYTFRGVGKSPYASVLTKIMNFIGMKRQTSVNEIMTFFVRDVTKQDLDKVLESIQMMKYCKIYHDGRVEYNTEYEGVYAQKSNTEDDLNELFNKGDD